MSKTKTWNSKTIVINITLPNDICELIADNARLSAQLHTLRNRNNHLIRIISDECGVNAARFPGLLDHLSSDNEAEMALSAYILEHGDNEQTMDFLRRQITANNRRIDRYRKKDFTKLCRDSFTKTTNKALDGFKK